MKSAIFRLGLVGCLAFCYGMMGKPALAQVTSDGTLSTSIDSPDGRNFTINGGDRAGNNLFHSFRDFSVPTGGSASFNNTTDVQNIFSRVTGGNLSQIDGLIRANGTANLFLLNPSGILFSPNARLEIGGSFISSTASSLRFSDGVEFSATTPSASPLLTVSVPVGLQFGQNSGGITVQRSGHRSPTVGFAPVDRSQNPPGLQVGAGQTLSLIGNGVNFSGGIASVNGGGHVEVGSVSNGLVSLNLTGQGWVGDYSDVQQFNDLHLAQQSLLDASGSNGSIQVQGRNIALSEGSALLLQNLGTQPSGNITVHATEALNLTGTTPNGRAGSYIRGDNLGMSQAGNINLSAAQLSLQNGGTISNNTFSPAPGGNVTVTVSGAIAVDGFAPANPVLISSISASTYSSANAGNLTVSTGSLRLLNAGAIASTSLDSGQSGMIRVNAQDLIEIAGNNPIILSPSVVSSATLSSGNANSLFVNTSRLVIRDGGFLGSTTLSTGSSGSVTVNASESIDVRGRAAGSIAASRIISSAEILDPATQAALGVPAIPSGNAGSLTINTPSLRITDGALVSVRNDGPGSAGDVQVNGNSVFLDHQGNITASTASGNGGSIRLNLQDNLTLHHDSILSANAAGTGNGGQIKLLANSIDLLGNSQISTQTSGSGNAGTLQLRVDQLRLNHGQIQAESLGTGNAGRLTIDADSVQLNNQSLISASTQVGRGGDVQLQVRDSLQLNDQSRILADAQRSGRGGNVSITTAQTVLRDRSHISTNAQGTAVGGALTITGDRLSLSNGSQITASTAGRGEAGSLNIQAIDAITLNGRNTRLAAASTTNAPAGSILLRSPQVTLSDRAAVSVSGQGRGGAGDLTIQATTIDLDQQSNLEAEVAGGDRGNITLDAHALLLRNRSTITTNATGRASGGNIQFNGTFLIGLNNSDIVARAQAGAGGNINITANSVLGIAPRSALTPDSDINASSQLGLNGSVSINNVDVKPDSGLAELPETVVDASQQVAATCAATQASRFVATGRGGIPENPTQELGSDRPWQDLRDLSALQTEPTTETTAPASSLVEATTFHHNPATGKVELAAAQPLPSNPIATCAGVAP